MAEKTEKQSNKTLIIILIIVILLLIAAVGAVLFFVLNKEEEKLPQPGESGFQIQYDEAAVALDEDSLRQQLAEAQKKAEEGQMALKYQNVAYSEDGTEFTCNIGNSEANSYDMYINIYDSTLTKQILLTGLIPPGQGIKEFTSEIPFEPGNHEAVLVLTQVEDDHATMHAQVKVTYTLIVQEQ